MIFVERNGIIFQINPDYPFRRYKSSGGGGSTSTSTSFTPRQEAEQGRAFDVYGPLLGQGQVSFPGTRVAPQAGVQQDIFGALPEFASTFGDLGGAPLQEELEATSGGLLRGEFGAQPITPEQESAFFQRAIRDPRQREFERTEAPLIREEFAGPGFYGSARASQVAEAQGDINAQLSEQRARLAFDVLGRNQQVADTQANRALAAINPALAVQDSPQRQQLSKLAGMQEVFKLADQERGQQQAEINASMQKFQEGQRLTDPEVLTVLLTLLGQSFSTTTGIQTSGSDQSALGTAFGAGIGALLAAPTGGLSVLAGAGLGAGIGGFAGAGIDF